MSPIINSLIAGQQAETPSGWYPPSYWPTDWGDDLGDTDDGFVLLTAVFEDGVNSVEIDIYCNSAGGTVDWGDGNTTTITSTAQTITHTYDYATLTAPSHDNYKMVSIVANFTNQFYGLKFSSLGGATTKYEALPYLAMKIRSNASSLTQWQPYDGLTFPYYLQYIDFGDTYVRSYLLLTQCRGLKKVILNNFGSNTTRTDYCFGNYAASANVGIDFNSLDWASRTINLYTFANASGGLEKPFNAAITNCTQVFGMFYLCDIFEKVTLTATGNVTTIYAAINAGRVYEFYMDDCANVTNTSNFKGAAGAVHPLHHLILAGLTVGIDLSNCQMQATEIDAFFTALGTAAGSQTIVVTGNPGAATCNTSIATGKGFTVTT